MDARKLFAFVLAAGAAGIVALMVRGMLGSKAPEHPVGAPSEISEVLVAAVRIEPGKPVGAGDVRWQPWPSKIIDPAFIRHANNPSAESVVSGTVARAPMVVGEPVTFAKIVKAQGAGVMAATLGPGMRAVAIPISIPAMVGGFVLPNNRVDVLVTQTMGDYPKRAIAKLVASDVRVLAVDQAAENKEQKAVADVKSVTLELSPEQARAISLAQAMGTLSLTLRGLGDVTPDNDEKADAKSGAHGGDGEASSGVVLVLRAGHMRRNSGGAQ